MSLRRDWIKAGVLQRSPTVGAGKTQQCGAIADPCVSSIQDCLQLGTGEAVFIHQIIHEAVQGFTVIP